MAALEPPASAAAPRAAAAAGEDSSAAAAQRERLELEDFDVDAGAVFDPVVWLNGRLASSGVPFDKLDQHLSSLAMRCQLLCQDASESIEVASNQLVAQLPNTGRDLERMREQAVKGHARLGAVLEGLRDADDNKQSGLHRLAEVDVVKTRVETAYSALKEVGSWERKVRECEQLVHSGKLPMALTQLASLKGVLDAFRMLPEYAKKEAQLQQLEESLLATARRRARQAVERNVVADLAPCGEVFASMGRPEELSALAEAVFAEVAAQAWNSQEPRGAEPSAAELAGAARAVLQASAQAFRERWPLLQSVDEIAASAAAGEEADAGAAEAGKPAGTAVAPTPVAEAGASCTAIGSPAAPATVFAVRAALAVLSSKLTPCLATAASAMADSDPAAKEQSAHLRASRVVALVAEYSEGFASLALVTPMAESPSLWAETCRPPPASGAEVLPWALLQEIALFVILRPMQDDAVALMPPIRHDGQTKLSEAVLAAESSARKLMQMPATWARYLEDKGCARLGAVWLAAVDATCEAFWRQWDSLLDGIKRALAAQAGHSGGGAPEMLSECMQLHTLLHGIATSQLSTFQAQVLQLAARLLRGPAAETAFGVALAEKLREDHPSHWCERLAAPSAEGLRAACATLEGLHPESPALAMKATKALPASTAALGKVEKQASMLVTQCCVQPVVASFATYADAPEWSRVSDAPISPFMAGSSSPLPCITGVGEHLFALMPQLERSHDGGPDQVQWLPDILDSIVETAMQKVMQIKQLTPTGAQQLITDLEYLHKVTDALGQGAATAAERHLAEQPAASGKLSEVLATITFLAQQQQRQRECAAKGEAFVEAPRDGVPPLGRRAERALRAAMGLGGAGAAPTGHSAAHQPPPPP